MLQDRNYLRRALAMPRRARRSVATRGSNLPKAVFFDIYSGTLQHLKTKFGGTFFIEIKIPAARHEALLSFMSGKFSTAKLMEEPWQVQLAAARSCWDWRETG